MPTKRKNARTSKAKQPEIKSFRVSRDVPPFHTFKFTKQTLYWTILLLVIVVMQLWILKVQLEVAHLTQELLLQEP